MYNAYLTLFLVLLIQFHDKMDPLLETLEGAVQRLRQPPPVAAEVEKIREQLADHRAAGLELDKLLPSFSALCARGEELITRAAHDDPAAQGECSVIADSHERSGFSILIHSAGISLKFEMCRYKAGL